MFSSLLDQIGGETGMNSCNFLGPKIKHVPKLAETGGTGVPKKQASR